MSDVSTTGSHVVDPLMPPDCIGDPEVFDVDRARCQACSFRQDCKWLVHDGKVRRTLELTPYKLASGSGDPSTRGKGRPKTILIDQPLLKHWIADRQVDRARRRVSNWEQMDKSKKLKRRRPRVPHILEAARYLAGKTIKCLERDALAFSSWLAERPRGPGRSYDASEAAALWFAWKASLRLMKKLGWKPITSPSAVSQMWTMISGKTVDVNKIKPKLKRVVELDKEYRRSLRAAPKE